MLNTTYIKMKMLKRTAVLRKTTNHLACCLHTNRIILGIESSCDDTGSAVVSSSRNILGEYLFSQREVVARHGGVMPLIARDLHKLHIQPAVEHVLKQANMTISDVDAVAVTVRPGLAMSVSVGLEYAKQLCKNFRKLLIPVHHMEAHALTIRLFNEDVEFPFLAYLISGGHCLLAVVHETNQFSLLGQSIDDAPGEIFDKVARRLKVHNCSRYRNISGGAAIEDLAKNGNPFTFQFTIPLQQYRNCNFSFSGLKSQAVKYIEAEECRYEIEADGIIPSASDLCASLQLSVVKHLCWRLQRAMEYIKCNELLPLHNRSLVVSGGTACNEYIRKAFNIVCCEMGYTLYAPPPKYCTDNGTMIAWNGVEKYLKNIDLYVPEEAENIVVQPRCPLGEDLSELVEKADIKCNWIKVDRKLHNKNNNPNK